jgi:hypothetical protein
VLGALAVRREDGALQYLIIERLQGRDATADDDERDLERRPHPDVKIVPSWIRDGIDVSEEMSLDGSADPSTGRMSVGYGKLSIRDHSQYTQTQKDTRCDSFLEAHLQAPDDGGRKKSEEEI